ncbi:MAG: OmpH family outer membrane protein [Pseudomonadota bacterium]
MRRPFLGLLLCAVISPGAYAQAPATNAPVFVISQERLLRNSRPTTILREAEAEMTQTIQRQYDAIKARLAEEEAALARQRDELAPADLQERAASFDRRYRLARRVAAEKATEVQTAFQEARANLVQVLPEIIGRLRLDVGAVAILDADQVLAIDPAHDLTDRAIQMLNERVPDPELPEIDLNLPVIPPMMINPPPGVGQANSDGDTPQPSE